MEFLGTSYVKRKPNHVIFVLSGGYRIYNYIRELLAISYPKLQFEILALDIDSPQGIIHEYYRKKATIQVVKNKYLPNYAKCIFGKLDKFKNAQHLTRKAKGPCVKNYKLSKFASRKKNVKRHPV